MLISWTLISQSYVCSQIWVYLISEESKQVVTKVVLLVKIAAIFQVKLVLCTAQWESSADDNKIIILFSYFFLQKTGFDIYVNCLLRSKNCQILSSGKIKRSYFKMLSAEFVPSILNIK